MIASGFFFADRRGERKLELLKPKHGSPRAASRSAQKFARAHPTFP
jgi:hypothetical protein